ncbi:cardiolipin synthase [Cytobacillus praedii]|uniref:Cardiolipin synthase n=1 Tax=Cytobacillus praedii TaxID=1742358 RepID=A0A4R1B4P4_9BACI|nr:cardiolipin synthase [Cytobacillus praedii]TCJ05249.1 cardiolipin synthase [Cytobacillus praedii]
MTILLTIAAILLIIALWLSLDFTLGRKKQLQGLKRVNSPFRASNIDIFTKGPELFADFFSELKKATHHIHILFYIVKDDNISKEFLNILKEKADEGVEVRLLLDRMGSFPIKKKTIESLKRHGIHFSFAHTPKPPCLFYTFQARNHRKITIIDGKIGYIGGFNIGKEYINLDPKLSPWRDYHLKMIGEGVADLQKEFLIDWLKETNTNLLANNAYFPALHTGKIQHQIVPSKGAFLEDTFSSLINRAKTKIFIGTPYFIPSERLLNDLIAAQARGITLTILVPKVSDHILVKEASYSSLRKLLENGAEVYEFQTGFYHAKTIIIDDEVCDIGTANFDRRSLFINYEINCYIYDQPFIKKVQAVIKQDIQHSRQLSLTELKQRRNIKEWAARLIAPLL